MSNEITQDLIDRMGSRSKALLETELFGEYQRSKGARALDGSVLLNTAVWEIVVPMIVATLSGLALDRVKKAIRSANRAKGRREQIDNAALKDSVVTVTEKRCVECVTSVRRELGPYGVKEERIEKLVLEVIKEVRV